MTVSAVVRRPAPASGTHAFASRFEMTVPAQREWMTSMRPSRRQSDRASVVGKAGESKESDARARTHHTTVPVEALRHHADQRAHGHRRGNGVYHDETHQDPPTHWQMATKVGHAYASTTVIYAGVTSDFKNQALRAALAPRAASAARRPSSMIRGTSVRDHFESCRN